MCDFRSPFYGTVFRLKLHPLAGAIDRVLKNALAHPSWNILLLRINDRMRAISSTRSTDHKRYSSAPSAKNLSFVGHVSGPSARIGRSGLLCLIARQSSCVRRSESDAASSTMRTSAPGIYSWLSALLTFTEYPDRRNVS